MKKDLEKIARNKERLINYLFNIKIESLKIVYKGLVFGKSYQEIHKELYKSTFKSFYVPLEFKKIILKATETITKRVKKYDELELSLIPIPMRIKNSKNKKRNDFIVEEINKSKVYTETNKPIYDTAREEEAKDKEEMIDKDKEEFRKNKNVFILLSRHDDCAIDHIDAQGKICYLEDYKNILNDENEIKKVEKIIKDKKLFSFEGVINKPTWFITRPNCRHFYEPLTIKEVESKSVNKLLKEHKMTFAVGNRTLLQTIKHDTRKERYKKTSIENIIKRYEERLKFHEELNKIGKSDILDKAIKKDKLLIDKWKKYYRSYK